MTDPIKAKIQELCPDMMEEHCQCCEKLKCDRSTTGCPWYVGSPITLAVVLRAIGKAKGEEAWEYAIDSLGRFMRDWGEDRHDTTSDVWNLANDNYDQQSEESKQFIGSLLGV